jgi:hypothetical protein
MWTVPPVRRTAVIGTFTALMTGAATAHAQPLTLGAVVTDPTGRPLPFATVEAELLRRRTVTDERGRFVFGSVDEGRYEVVVRQVGYVALRRTLVARPAGTPADTIALSRVVLQLAAVAVRADARCRTGGIDGDGTTNVDTLLAQLRLNGERFRLLADSLPRPLRYARERRYFDAGGAPVATRGDTVERAAADAARYAPGRAAVREDDAWTVSTPGPELIGDSTFLSAHCFRYTAVDTVDGATAHRVDFTTVDTLRGPDFVGALWLDTQSLALRRATWRLINPPDALPGEVELTTTFGVLADGRPVATAREAIQRQRRPARLDGQRWSVLVDRQRLVP